MKSNQRYILLAFLAIAVAVGFSVRGLSGPIMAALEVSDPRLLGVLDGSSLIGVGLGIVTFTVLLRGASYVHFTDEVVSELRKVTWPDREDTIRSTIIVVSTSLFFALMLAGFDWLWGSLTSAFLFTKG